MVIATKTLATILLIVILTLSSVNVSASSSAANNKRRDEKQLERLYRHHDRKLELRASVLGISADELRERIKTQGLEKVIKQSGFKDRQSFHVAMVGRLREELKKRGWDDEKIRQFVQKRLDRYEKKHPV